MAEIKSTRLRHIKAGSLEEIEMLVESLPHKIEIKGQPVKDGINWILFFTIPDQSKMDSIDVS